VLHDVLMKYQASRDEQCIAVFPSGLLEIFQQQKYIPLIKLHEQLLSVTSHLVKHVTYHTGLVFDKRKLGIGIQSIYR